MSDIKVILCHAGDASAAMLLGILASSDLTGNFRRRLLSREMVKDGTTTIFYRRVVELRRAGDEKTVNVEVVTLLPNSISRATFLERAGLKYSEVFYVTVMSNHEAWLELEPKDTVEKPFVLIEPSNRYLRISGFDSALVINDLRGASSDDPAILNAVSDGVRVISGYVLGPRPKTKKARRNAPAEVQDGK